MEQRSCCNGRLLGTCTDVEVSALFSSIARYRRVLRRIMRQFEVPACDRADVMQDILLTAWRRMQGGGFQPAHVDVEYVLRRWLVGIAWRQILRDREHECRWHECVAIIGKSRPPCQASPLDQVNARLTLCVLERLTPELRAVLSEAALSSTATEIAAELDKNPHTTLKRLHRGRTLFCEAPGRWRGLRRSAGPKHGRAP